MIGRILREQVLMGKVREKGLKSRCLPSFIALSAMAASVAIQPAVYADDAPMPIKRISVNPEQQLVIEFATPEGSFPSKPNVQDFPGTNHRLVLDFKDSIIDKEQIPPAKETLTVLTKAYPAIKGLRYAALTNTATPTARIVLDLPETLKTNPHIVKLEANQVTIDLGFESGGAGDATEKVAADSQAATTSAAAPANATTAAAPVATPPTPTNTVASSDSSRERIEAPAATGSEADKITAAASSTPVATGAPTAAGDTGLLSKTDTTAGSAAGNAPTPTPDLGKGQDSALTTSTPKSASEILASPTSSNAQTPGSTAELKPASTELPGSASGAGAETTSASLPSTTAKEDASSSSALTGLTKDSSEKPADQVATITPASATAAPPTSVTMPVSAAPSGEDAKHQYADAVKHYNQGYELHKANKLPGAIAEYQAAIAANPGLSQAYSNLGMIYNQQHNYPEALTQFRKALAIDPKDAITYNGIGAALRAQKDLAGAIKNWQTAVSLDPKLATAHYNLGTAYEIQRDYDKALDCYKQAVKNDYRLGEAYYRMGLILQKRNNLEEALEQFNKALKVSTKAEYSQDAHQRIALLSERKATKK
jgi:tetratricopeptide (TPR) repeat protein